MTAAVVAAVALEGWGLPQRRLTVARAVLITPALLAALAVPVLMAAMAAMARVAAAAVGATRTAQPHIVVAQVARVPKTPSQRAALLVLAGVAVAVVVPTTPARRAALVQAVRFMAAAAVAAGKRLQQVRGRLALRARLSLPSLSPQLLFRLLA
jgi:hypothetical protein